MSSSGPGFYPVSSLRGGVAAFTDVPLILSWTFDVLLSAGPEDHDNTMLILNLES